MKILVKLITFVALVFCIQGCLLILLPIVTPINIATYCPIRPFRNDVALHLKLSSEYDYVEFFRQNEKIGKGHLEETIYCNYAEDDENRLVPAEEGQQNNDVCTRSRLVSDNPSGRPEIAVPGIVAKWPDGTTLECPEFRFKKKGGFCMTEFNESVYFYKGMEKTGHGNCHAKWQSYDNSIN